MSSLVVLAIFMILVAIASKKKRKGRNSDTHFQNDYTLTECEGGHKVWQVEDIDNCSQDVQLKKLKRSSASRCVLPTHLYVKRMQERLITS